MKFIVLNKNTFSLFKNDKLDELEYSFRINELKIEKLDKFSNI